MDDEPRHRDFARDGSHTDWLTVFSESDVLVIGGFASHDGVRWRGGAFVRFGGRVAVNDTGRTSHSSLGSMLPLSVVGGTPPKSDTSAFHPSRERNVAGLSCDAYMTRFTSTYDAVSNWRTARPGLEQRDRAGPARVWAGEPCARAAAGKCESVPPAVAMPAG